MEAKYGAGLSTTTSGNSGETGFPADQLIRNARVGLLGAGYYRFDRLFEVPPRDFVLILLTPDGRHPLVTRYRDPQQLRAAIPRGDRLVGLPRLPFVGQLGYARISRLLRGRRRFFTRAERQIVEDLAAYLDFKKGRMRRRGGQVPLPVGPAGEGRPGNGG